MERVAFLLSVRKDKVEEYKQYHKAVWPEMLEALHRNGWHNYSLFMGENGLLLGYFESKVSFQESLDGMSREDVNTRWQALMAPFFEKLKGRPDRSMAQLVEVFHLE